MTRSKLAELLHINKSTITKWFKGKIGSMKETHLVTISNYFNVNLWWLLGYDSPKEKENEEHRNLRNEVTDILLRLTNNQLKEVLKFIKVFLLESNEK